MGNSESSCYNKDEKTKSKQKVQKEKSRSSSNSSILKSIKNVSTSILNNVDTSSSEKIECNSKTLEQSTSSSDDAYTPVRKENVKKKEFLNQNEWDPRSPSDGIIRTPIQLNSECVMILDDPRSPSYGIDRTPIVQPDYKSKPVVCKQNLSDPRSPTVEINRTPLTVTTASDNLRRAVLLTNTLNTSPLLKKIPYNSDGSSTASLPSGCDNTASDDSFYSANNFVANDASSSFISCSTKASLLNCDIAEVIGEVVDQVCVSSIAVAAENNDAKAVHQFVLQGDDEGNDAKVPDTDVLATEYSKPCASGTKGLPTMESELNCFESLPVVEKPEVSSFETSVLSTVNDEDRESSDSRVSAMELSNPISCNDAGKQTTVEPTTLPYHLDRKSSIPSLKGQERKRRTGVNEKPKTVNRNENDTALPIRKERSLKKFDSQTTRSPLSLLGHSNSPEPKRLRQTTDRNQDRFASTSQNKKATSSRSRLPRYKLNHGL